MYRESLTNEEVNDFPLIEFPGEIVVVNDPIHLDEVVEVLNTHHIIGFDTETKPSFKKGNEHKVSLIQISTQKFCYLVRVQRTGITPAFKTWLENDNFKKVGLSLRDDLRKLHSFTNFEPHGFIDLQEKVKKYGITDQSLKKITAIVLGYRISKRQQLTDWENRELTIQQQRYGATDAWICLQIYNKLKSFH